MEKYFRDENIRNDIGIVKRVLENGELKSRYQGMNDKIIGTYQGQKYFIKKKDIQNMDVKQAAILAGIMKNKIEGVLTPVGLAFEGSFFYEIYPFVHLQTIHEYVISNDSWDGMQKLDFLQKLLDTFEKILSRDFMVYDIKIDNILIDKALRPVLIDFAEVGYTPIYSKTGDPVDIR